MISQEQSDGSSPQIESVSQAINQIPFVTCRQGLGLAAFQNKSWRSVIDLRNEPQLYPQSCNSWRWMLVHHMFQPFVQLSG